jgi:hypothetical protein
VEKATDLALLAAGRRVLFRDLARRCEKCGAPIAPQAMLDRIGSILGEDDPAFSSMTKYCIDCRQTIF